MNNQTRTTVRIITYVTAAILVLGIFAATGAARANRYQSQLQMSYQRAVEDLASSVQSINTTLLKQQYAGTSTQMEKLATQLWRDTSAAKQSLSRLPAGEEPIAGTYKLLSQVGEYSLSLTQRAAKGESISDEELESLQKLREYCGTLNDQLYQLGQDVLTGEVSFEEQSTTLGTKNNPVAEMPAVADGFSDFEREMTDYPTLIYDGPFSDHILDREPKMTKGANTVDRSAARETAAKALGKVTTELKRESDEEGSMPAYNFSSGDAWASVTKEGGYLCSVMNSRTVGAQAKTVEEGRKLAREYLTKLGIKSMQESYYETSGGVLTVNFAYSQDDVIVYPDLIKVSVALDNGEIVGYDARGYLVNHQNRKIEAPALTEEKARQSVSKNLTVTSSRRALIPSSGLNEVSCYEFLCKDKEGQQVLVYVDAKTGEEEQILLVYASEDGVLTV